MKLLRYGPLGAEKPGCLDVHGQIRDLSQHIPDITGDILMPEGLDYLHGLEQDSLPLVAGKVRLGAPVHRVGKLLCIGLNYLDHAAEMNVNPPAEPILFGKATSAICGANDDLILPHGSTHTDWEVELGVVVGKPAKRVTEAAALDHVAGYCVINDVSERHYQLHGTTQWFKGKSCDTFGPIGPWLVTKDEVPDPQHLTLWLSVDDKRYQQGQTSNMIFSVARIISYLSHFFTLHPGDIISTGTPAGVGLGQKPEPVYLKSGQCVRLGISGLGEQEHRVVEEKAV